MNQQQFSPTAALCLVLAGWAVASLAGFGSAGVEKTAAVVDRLQPALAANAEIVVAPQATATEKTAVGNPEVAVAGKAVTEAAADTTAADTIAPDTVAPETPAKSDASQPVVVASLGDPAQTLAPETPSLQVATASPTDPAPAEARVDLSSIDADECLVADPCIDRYLWAVYQRTPKEDSIKEHELRKVTVKRKGKMVTVTRSFVRLVDEDFTWKDPKAADKAGMPMMDYVIGGMDRSFKLKLFHMLRAAEEAGLSPGITSAFRDDYRQSIASGLKAASDRSYHGGSSRGGYGHGLAADVVSVNGATRDQRWSASEKLWKWIDANGKQFGVARPYLDHDPPHVAPVDGQEYAAHHGGAKVHAASRMKARHAIPDRKRTRVAAR